MSLAAGSKLGPYEILAPIGKGGMGEVYRAHDPRMGRDVAVKVSAQQFSDRFSREVRAIAALNHPNICQIYDVGPNYLVMELVDGENLKGPLPLDTAVKYAGQIAEALEAAHEKNIVHRDLKPANIKIRTDGVVKVLDFGLAKLPQAEACATEDSPTLSMGMTQAGVILGTAAYMSPEQARGEPVDKRADIWAFGVVFYEMLAGQHMYQGKTVSDVLAAVLIKEPDLSKVPPQVRKLLRRCLEKEPKHRLRDIADAMALLEEEAPSPAADVPVAPVPPQRTSVAWIAAAGALLLVAAAAGFGWWRATRPVEQPLVQLDADLGSDISLRPIGPGQASSEIISPDGTRLVYVASVAGGPAKLFTRRLDQPKATELAGTEGVTFPFFSPDGQWVGFATANKLSKISVEGGAAVPLADVKTYGASWGDSGAIVAGQPLPGKGMVLIPSGGGAATPLTEMTSGEVFHSFPQFLPGGKAVLFTAYGGVGNAGNIQVVSLADRRRKTLVPGGGSSPHYVAASNGAGYLLYSNKGTIFAVPFDPDRLETSGTAVPVLDGVAYEALDAVAHIDFSRSGAVVYRKGVGGGSGMVTIQWLDGAGKKEPLLSKPGPYVAIRLSPDGKNLAVEVLEGASQDIKVYDPQRDAMTPLTFGGATYLAPTWSQPDGKYIVFGSQASGLFWTRADGAGQPQPLTQHKVPQIPWSFSPDGKWLAYLELSGASGSSQLWTAPVESSGGQLRLGKPEPFLKDQFTNFAPAFSPDGRWIAYRSDESGMNQVYVRPFPPPASGQGSKVNISNNGGEFPVWSRTGSELLYLSGDQIMAVHYTVKGGELVPDKPRVWASKLAGAQWIDLAPDGKRMAVELPVATAEAPKAEHEVTFLFNFLDELRRRAPAK